MDPTGNLHLLPIHSINQSARPPPLISAATQPQQAAPLLYAHGRVRLLWIPASVRPNSATAEARSSLDRGRYLLIAPVRVGLAPELRQPMALVAGTSSRRFARRPTRGELQQLCPWSSSPMAVLCLPLAVPPPQLRLDRLGSLSFPASSVLPLIAGMQAPPCSCGPC